MSHSFNPNAASQPDSGVFGLPFSEAQSSVVYVPVPWEATTSYRGGTSQGPELILNASRQVDLYDLDVHNPYEAGLFMQPVSAEIIAWNDEAKRLAEPIISAAVESEEAIRDNPDLLACLHRVNSLGKKINQSVLESTRAIYAAGKIPAIVGGDHSVPYGAFQATAERFSKFGILHFDAHSDTRIAYEGFQWSHASIMYNALSTIPQLTKLVQVGIRDVCAEEIGVVESQKHRVNVFYDRDLAQRRLDGAPFATVAKEIVAGLPQDVWISFDIDGLDPRFCPNTGTPVPGGLDYAEALHLIAAVAKSGRKIIGFDLNEVSPGESKDPDAGTWDGIVGARLLYKLTAWTLFSQGKAQLLRA